MAGKEPEAIISSGPADSQAIKVITPAEAGLMKVRLSREARERRAKALGNLFRRVDARRAAKNKPE